LKAKRSSLLNTRGLDNIEMNQFRCIYSNYR
jgi:hypothetical protein